MKNCIFQISSSKVIQKNMESKDIISFKIFDFYEHCK